MFDASPSQVNLAGINTARSGALSCGSFLTSSLAWPEGEYGIAVEVS